MESSRIKKGDIVRITQEARDKKVPFVFGIPSTRGFEEDKEYTVKYISKCISDKNYHYNILLEGSCMYVHEDFFILVRKASDKDAIPQYVNKANNKVTIHGIGYYLYQFSLNSFFLQTEKGHNDAIFEFLEISDASSFISKIVGYTPSNGMFPPVKSIEDINKIIHALKNYEKPSLKKIIGYKVKSGFWNVAHRALQSGLPTEIIAYNSPTIAEAEKFKVLDIWFEPIFEDLETIVGMAGGAFQLKIKDRKVFHKDEDITKFVRELVEYFQLPEFGNHTCSIKNLTFSSTGCESAETSLEEWKKIYNKII